MALNLRNITLLVLVLIAAGVEFAQRYISLNETEFWLVAAGMVLITAIGRQLSKSIGPTLLFFTLVHMTRYANEYVTTVFDANFSGTYFLVPVLLFTAAIMIFKSIRDTIGWWRRDTISRTLFWQMALALLLGSLGMYWYLSTNEEHLSRFLAMLPRGGVLKIVALGIVFALMNAAVEEFIIRGMVWNGLAKVISNPILLITLQAMIFGASHYFGLPGGIEGVSMIFLWSLFIGYVRWKSGGLLGAIGMHFFANLSQFFMLYLF